MTDHDVAAGLFKLAKAQRGRAIYLRTEANKNDEAYRGDRAEAISAELREMGSKCDDSAAFYKRAAQLAKVGAEMAQAEAEIETVRDWAFGFQAIGRLFFFALSISKLKGTNK